MVLRLTASKPVVIEVHTDNCESFAVPAKEVNGAVLFAVYEFDEDDYEFVKRWYEDIDFYVVVNGDPTEWDAKIIDLIGSECYIKRPNIGYDAWAWKEGLAAWKSQLAEYDLVGLVNNSCIYAVDMKKLFEHAIDYDMYGLYQDVPRLYSCSGQHFLQSYCIIINKRLFTTKAFSDYWDRLPKIATFKQAVRLHECRFTDHFYNLGYKIGSYYSPVYRESVYSPAKRNQNGYYREFLKYKELKKYPNSHRRFIEDMHRLSEKGYR